MFLLPDTFIGEIPLSINIFSANKIDFEPKKVALDETILMDTKDITSDDLLPRSITEDQPSETARGSSIDYYHQQELSDQITEMTG